ncbi:MAG: M48 family metallopeptidase, partial [Rhodospirillales bacterium]|nr:M48 family metallopeptidase [Rhodospirillales bacterium]
EAGAVLVLPRGVGLAEGMRFARDRRGWIASRLAALPPRIAFAPGVVISCAGTPLTIRHAPAARGPVRREGDDLVVGGQDAHLARRVRDWLKAEARTTLAARSHAFAARLGARVRALRLADPKSRWGSCSADGNLSYSWRLILAPPTVMDYVVAHEVAHLAELNHGPRFWRLVADLVGDIDGPRAWLRRSGASLLRYG